MFCVFSNIVYSENSTTFTEKSFCDEVEGCKPPVWHFTKKRLRHRCFPEASANILETLFFMKLLWVTASKYHFQGSI